MNLPDGLIVDGETQLPLKVKDQAMSLLRRAHDWHKANISLLRRQYPKSSGQLAIRIGPGRKMMVQSHFISRDEKNRLIPYACYVADLTDLYECLKSSSKVAGYVLNEDDLKLIESYLKWRKNKLPVLIGGGVVALLILTIALWN